MPEGDSHSTKGFHKDPNRGEKDAYVHQNGKLVKLNGRDPVMVSDLDDHYRLWYKNDPPSAIPR
jgi:hypothetical protein